MREYWERLGTFVSDSLISGRNVEGILTMSEEHDEKKVDDYGGSHTADVSLFLLVIPAVLKENRFKKITNFEVVRETNVH